MPNLSPSPQAVCCEATDSAARYTATAAATAAIAPSPLRPVASTPATPTGNLLRHYSHSKLAPADIPSKNGSKSKSAPDSPMIATQPQPVGTSTVPATAADQKIKLPGSGRQSAKNGLRSRSQSQRGVPSIAVHETGSRPSSRRSERKRSGLGRKKSGDSVYYKSASRPATSNSSSRDTSSNEVNGDTPPSTFDEVQSMKLSNSGSASRKPSSAPNRLAEPKSAGTLANNRQGSIKGGNSPRARRTTRPSKAISADEDMLSRRVRLMYEKGNEDVSDTEVAKATALENGVLWEEFPETAKDSTDGDTDEPDNRSLASSISRNTNNYPSQQPSFTKEAHELAGGIEYWGNIGAGDVDRYGFIRQRDDNSSDPADRNPLQRVSTSLLVATQTPRRKHSIRPPSAVSNRPFGGLSPMPKFSGSSMRPTSSQSGYSPPLRRTSRFRHATNRLPHNRNRRVKDQAGDMLTLPSDVVKGQQKEDTPLTRSLKKKEWRREDKWMKMAKPMKKNGDGGGTTFEFDTHSTKLIERTWKGIPDRWRATAWYAFLEASAKRHADSPDEEELMEAFHEFQYTSSPDDMQIDIDVPRTISSHIMFRRRYRGGQRLLFRVLHAMSLYFPDTGYVQGMAALAATLLAYYDEEHAFIMLVRLWQLRGLEELYKSGFAGLMGALEDFERDWLEKGEVAAKLVSSINTHDYICSDIYADLVHRTN